MGESQGRKRELNISVFRCNGLVGKGHPGQLRPFVFYQFYMEEDVVTRTHVGPDPVFDEMATFNLYVNSDLQRYLDRDNLDVVVFDENAPLKTEGQDVIGTATIPLSSLLIDTAI